MPMGSSHCREDPLDVFQWHIVMKQVAHGIDENALRLLPFKRQLQCLWMQGQPKAVGILLLPHSLQPQGHPFRVAVIASRAKVVTARGRVPRSEEHTSELQS